MKTSKDRLEKHARLAAHGNLHSHPEHVRDAQFRDSDFFDPSDLVQVRYEMLRRHRIEGRPVTEVVNAFGVSRQLFYVLAQLFQSHGLVGLIPRKRGPKGASKCSDKVLAYVEKRRANQPQLTIEEAISDVSKKFDVQIHRRTLERGLARREKKRRNSPRTR